MRRVSRAPSLERTRVAARYTSGFGVHARDVAMKPFACTHSGRDAASPSRCTPSNALFSLSREFKKINDARGVFGATRWCHVRTHPARNFLSFLSHRPRLTSSELANWRIPNFHRTSSALGNLFRCWLALERDPTFRCRPFAKRRAPTGGGRATPRRLNQHLRSMSDGFAAAQARKEAYLASLILQDVERRGEAVKERGVSAWAHRPRNREQVNERFLRNTLRGVSSNNRRAERSAAGRSGSPAREGRAKRGRDTHDGVADRGRGDRSGAHQKGSLEVEEGTSAGSSSSDASSSESERDTRPDDTEKGRGMKDDELAAFLSRPRVKRGRGAVGSRADEPGPFLPGSSSVHSGRHHASSHTVRGYSLVLPDEAARRDDATIAAMREKAEKKTRKKAEKKERKERKRTRKEGVKAGKASPKKRKR